MNDTFELYNLKTTLEEIIFFLENFQWLHNFPMIKVLSNTTQPINKMPEDWKQWFMGKDCDISKVLSSTYENIEDCPSLKDFFWTSYFYSITSLLQIQCPNLSFASVSKNLRLEKQRTINYTPSTVKSVSSDVNVQLSDNSDAQGQNQQEEKSVNNIWKIIKQIKPKKKHEIERLSRFIKKIKKITNSNKVLDIGSGLGQLDMFLHMKHNYKVVGAELSDQKIETASKLKNEYLGHNCPDVNYISWHLEDDSKTINKAKEITGQLCVAPSACQSCENTNEPEETVDLVSLHSCADLSPIMLKIFINSPHISSIVMMSCCYHKMNPLLDTPTEEEDAQVSRFRNFPLSQCLNGVLKERKFRLSAHALRLASEESMSHWQKRSEHCLVKDVQSIAYRGILQNVCDKHSLKPNKLRRHSTKKSSYETFDEYVDLVFSDYTFKSMDGEDYTNTDLLRSDLHAEYLDQEEHIPFVGFVRSLQLTLQPVLESLLLLDRIVYLREQGIHHSGIIQLFDEVKSPRNKAVFGFKCVMDRFNKKLQ